MPRVARIVIPGIPHHVTQRGNRRVRVFDEEADFRLYINLLRYSAGKHRSRVWAYCIMPNHVHLVAVPIEPLSLARTFQTAHQRYALAYNARRGFCGHLWQGRFFSTALDPTRFWATVRYVERNPVRAGLVGRAEDYLWSSARAHCSGTPDPLLAPGLPPLDAIGDWGAWLAEEEPPEKLATIRRETARGRPLAP